MSAVTLKNTVEEALAEHVPEISAVEVVPEDKPPKDLVQIQKPDQGGVPKAEHGWVSGPLEMEVKPEKAVAVRAGEHEILLIRCLSGVKAYRNACAHQGMPLDGGLVDPEAGTITCPFHGFQFDSESGECFSAPACQLESFPVRVDAGRIYIRPTN